MRLPTSRSLQILLRLISPPSTRGPDPSSQHFTCRRHSGQENARLCQKSLDHMAVNICPFRMCRGSILFLRVKLKGAATMWTLWLQTWLAFHKARPAHLFYPASKMLACHPIVTPFLWLAPLSGTHFVTSRLLLIRFYCSWFRFRSRCSQACVGCFWTCLRWKFILWFDYFELFQR